jgi:putative sugar O-methyltransferase
VTAKLHDYPDLRRALNDMYAQPELYRPTAFWQEAASQIALELQEFGVEKIRSQQTALGFFVPTYGCPGNSLTPALAAGIANWLKTESSLEVKPQLAIQQFLSGYLSAHADYRVLQAADNPAVLPYLHLFSESQVGNPVEQFEFDGRHFSRSSLNYLLGMAMLKKHLAGELPRTVLEIGGGFGALGEVLGSAGINGLRYIDIDIPPMNFVAQYYLGQLFGPGQVTSYSQTAENATIEIDSLPMVSVLCSWQIEKLLGRVDLFVNFISFQEMEPNIVGNYLHHVTRLGARWILLRNMREGKNRKSDDGVGVKTPILGDDYLGMLPGYQLVERSVVPYGYQTVDGFHSELLLLKRKELEVE